jgi:hypothetical protein
MFAVASQVRLFFNRLVLNPEIFSFDNANSCYHRSGHWALAWKRGPFDALSFGCSIGDHFSVGMEDFLCADRNQTPTQARRWDPGQANLVMVGNVWRTTFA